MATLQHNLVAIYVEKKYVKIGHRKYCLVTRSDIKFVMQLVVAQLSCFSDRQQINISYKNIRSHKGENQTRLYATNCITNLVSDLCFTMLTSMKPNDSIPEARKQSNQTTHLGHQCLCGSHMQFSWKTFEMAQNNSIQREKNCSFSPQSLID